MKNNINFPKYLSIQTTSLCNASCIFCPYQDIKELFPTKIMDMHLFKRIIDECSNYKNIERIILYMNNEPLTDPYLIERINYAKEKVPWASIHILTNGLLLTEEMGDKLLDSKLDWLGISFHGIRKETIEKTMGIPFKIAFERINKFIEKIKKKKNIEEYLMITFLKHKYLTEEEKEEAFNYWKNKGIKRISYFEGPISRAGNVKSLPKVYHKKKVVGCNSIWADEMLHIVESGRVILCCMDWRREVILGDLSKESIYSVWNGERKKVWEMITGQKKMPDNFLCRRCEEAVLEKKELYPIVSKTNSFQILLVINPCWGTDAPPISLGCLVSYLKDKGIEVEVLDFNIEVFNRVPLKIKELWNMENSYLWWTPTLFYKKIYPLLSSEIEKVSQEILNSKINTVGFSVYATNRLFTKEVIKIIKQESDKKVIVGGRGVYDILERKNFPEGLVDYFIVGEGEDALCRLIKDKKAGSGVLTSIDEDTKPVFLDNLSHYPLIKYENFDLSQYQHQRIYLLMNRGCIFKCAFCNDWRYIGKLRTRKAEDIYREIEYHFYKNNIRKFYFNDQAINVNLKELNKLCDLLIKADFKIEWIALAIPLRQLTLELLLKMKRAGCITLNCGIESGSNKVLKLMNKKFTIEEVEKVLRDIRKVGINTQVNFIVGFPGEEEEDFVEIQKFIERNRENICGITNLNMCNAVLGSDLSVYKDKYNIIFPDNLEERDTHWSTKDGKNNYQVRLDRLKRIIKQVLDYNLSIFTTNLPGGMVSFKDNLDKKQFYQKRRFEKTSEDKLYGETGFNERVYYKVSNKKTVFRKIDSSHLRNEDFLLINLPPWAQENPHIGIGYLCSYLRTKGLKPKVIDLNKSFYLNHPDFKLLWHVENKNFWSNEKTFPLICEIFKKDIEEAIEEILGFNCDILGFSVVDPKERLTIEFIKRIKQKNPNKKIILGGPATSTYEQRKIFLDNISEFIDAFVIGEGEETLACLLDRFLNKKEIIDVEGCYVRNDGKWVYKERLPINPLDRIPFPTYEEFDLNLYGKSLLVEWSRGCRGRCAFCKNYRLFSNFRVKSPDWIIRELRYHRQKYGIEEFTVVDNILNGDLKNLNEVCNRIIKENLKIRWTGQIAPHKNMDYDFFKKMRKAGCFKLQIGLESGSDKVLELMRKTFTSEISERNIRLAKKAGIETEIFTMIGFPGETEKDFKETYDFVKRNAGFIDTIKSINTLHLIAGTEVYEKAYDKFNMKPLPKENWHYLWETYSGNNYKVRKRRAQRLLDLTSNSGIRVMETNIMEGKENIFDVIKGKKRLEERLAILKDSINTLQELPQKRKIIKKKRSIFKWLILIGVFLYTYIYIVYFWIYAKIKNRVLLGGKWSK